MKSNSYAVWHLRSGLDRRFRAGHPWAYSNELTESPKGLEPGAPVELREASGKFLARGYGNPSSLIAFRAVSRNEAEADPLSPEGVFNRLESALRVRESLGLGDYSYRLCFGEADQLPGLILDRYALETGTPAARAQVFVIQLHTAGADRLREALPGLLEKLTRQMGSKSSWESTAIVLRNDIGVRVREGLKEEESYVLRDIPGVDLSDVRIRVRSALSTSPVIFRVNLKNGQKTGFFLDQASNVRLALAHLTPSLLAIQDRPIRVLDLFCYVGQWGTQVAHALTAAGARVEVTAVDASAPALEFAKKNIENAGATCEAKRADVLRDLASFAPEQFDLVISDPPALVKGRKDLPQGTHAYLQLNTEAFRVTRRNGALVCCSCSALLEEENS